MGASKPWPEAMKTITGSENMSADSIMRYFAPLLEWLKEQNRGYSVEWTDSCPRGSFEDNHTSGTAGVYGSTLTTALLTIVAMSVSIFRFM